ncbi:MAG: cation transporter [Spirochaetales bacterium]|nr:cation transporter [Spirochaetales bacterium]
MAKKQNTAPLERGDGQERIGIIRKASWVGIVINFILSLMKLGVGFLCYSFALIGDGIDSLTDVITSAVTLVTANISSRPPDKEHPYGHGRAETIATKILSFIIFFAGAQLAFTSIKHIITPEVKKLPEFPVFYVIAISIIGKIFLSIYKKRAGIKAKSAMLIADAKNMKNDVLISVSVLIGLVFTVLLKIPMLDSLTALLVSFWILKTAFSIFMETSRELMDGVDDPEIYKRVFKIVKTIPGTENPHKTRIRKLNNVYIIDMDIEVAGNLTVEEGHTIAMEVEKAIRKQIIEIYDINVHVEPTGNYEKRESFGLNEELINNKE